MSSSFLSESDRVIQGRWFVENDLISTRSTYVDRLLGLDAGSDDEIYKFLNNSTDSTNLFFNGKSHYQLRNLCLQVLTQKVPRIGLVQSLKHGKRTLFSRIRYWDSIILLVNFIFFLFLCAKVIFIWKRKLKNSVESTMFKEFFVLVILKFYWVVLVI